MNPRDLAQRSIGCIGFSAIAHSSLLAVLLLAPRSSDVDRVSKPAAGGGNSSPVEVLVSQPVETSTSASNKVTEPEAPASIETAQPAAKEDVVVPKKEVKVATAPKHAPAKKAKAVAVPIKAKALKTVEKSEVATETPKENAQLEELSPVIAEESAHEKEAAEAETQQAAPEAAEPVAAEPPAAVNETPKEKSAPQPEAAAPKTEQAIKLSDAKPAPPGPEVAASSTNAAQTKSDGERSEGGQGASIGPGMSANGQGSGEQTKAVEASARNPLPGNPLPSYPRQDRMQNRQGTTILLGDVRRDGSIENVRLDKSSGSREMDMVSINAFRRWKFAAGPEAVVRKAFQFRLQGDAQVGYTTLKR